MPAPLSRAGGVTTTPTDLTPRLGWLTPAAYAATFSTIAADAATTERTPLMAG